MEMNPRDDDRPATQGIVRSAESALRGEIRAVRDAIDDAVRKFSGIVQSAFQPLTDKIAVMDAKLDRSIQRLDAKIDAHHRDAIGTIQAFAGKLEAYERETYAIRAPIDEHGKRLAYHERRIVILEAKTSNIV